MSEPTTPPSPPNRLVPPMTTEAIERNSFTNRKAKLGNNEAALRKNNMRKGIAGDWKNHFSQQQNDRLWLEFGWMAEKLGYKK